MPIRPGNSKGGYFNSFDVWLPNGDESFYSGAGVYRYSPKFCWGWIPAELLPTSRTTCKTNIIKKTGEWDLFVQKTPLGPASLKTARDRRDRLLKHRYNTNRITFQIYIRQTIRFKSFISLLPFRTQENKSCDI